MIKIEVEFLYSRSMSLRFMKKNNENQIDSRRSPRQARSLEKVELILEASRRILESGGLEAFTTNRVAELAGVSIGTLYQYFPNKRSVLNELTQRELGTLASEIMAVAKDSSDITPEARVRSLIQAVVKTYGGRSRVHGELMQYILTCGYENPMSNLREAIIGHLTSNGVVDSSLQRRSIPKAKAFVLTYAISGVLQAMIRASQSPDIPDLKEIEDALIELVLDFH